jgi:iron complex transport system permease protein
MHATSERLTPAAPLPGRRGAVLRSAGLAGSLLVLAGAILLSLRIGSVPLSTAEAVGAFTDFDGSNAHLIVRTLRLPRTLVALAVGAALAVAGVLLQAVTRNPLAEPAILGINAGASFAIVTAVFLLGGVAPATTVWFAFAGALGAVAVVYLVASSGRGGATPVKLALAGAVVAALLGSWISAILITNERTLDEVRFWLAGSVAGRDLAILAQVAPFLVAGLLVAFALIPALDAISLGDDVAAGLGQRTGLVRGSAIGSAVVLSGASVAAAGPIAFVGLAVPHAVRRVVGPRHRWLLPFSAIHGAVLLLVADVLGRIAMRPSEIAVGIVTAIVGAPVLVHLVRTRSLGDLR